MLRLPGALERLVVKAEREIKGRVTPAGRLGVEQYGKRGGLASSGRPAVLSAFFLASPLGRGLIMVCKERPGASMNDRKEEIRRLLGLFRRGGLDEELLLEQLAEIQDNGDKSDDGPLGELSAEEPASKETVSEDNDSTTLLAGRLDAWRAAERSGSLTLAAWADNTDDEELGGGLRGAAARAAAHAELFERRLADLGADAVAAVPAWMEKYNAALLDPVATDADRLAAVVAEFPDVEDAVRPLREFAEALQADPLTRQLLMTVCEDQVTTLAWFHRAWQARKEQ